MSLRGKMRTSLDVPWRNMAKLDLAWGVAAPIIAVLLRDERTLFDQGHLYDTLLYIGLSSVLTPISLIYFRLTHRVSRFFSVDDAMIVFLASAVAVISTVLACFLLTRLANIPRSVPVLHFLTLATGNMFARIVRYVRRRNRDRPGIAASGTVENLIVVGVSDLSWYYIEIVRHLMSDVYNIVALLDDRTSLQGRYVQGLPVAGRTSDIDAVLEEYAIHGVPIHRLVLGNEPPALAFGSFEELLRAAKRRNVNVDVLPERLGLGRRRIVRSVETRTPAEDWNRNTLFWKLKRGLDIAVSGTMLLIAAPVSVIIWLVVLFDCGMPVLFWQVRGGYLGRKIAVYKYRTLKAPFTASGKPVAEERRLSFVGRFLRRTHLDELPQLVGVLKGDMSLIGPRPLLPVDLPHQVGLRTAVRPGITGWAQINGDTLITAEEKNAMDEWYVRHACWKVEFAIVIATVRALLVPIKRNEHAIAEALSEQAARREQDQQAQEAEQARPLRPSGDQVNCTGSEGKLHEMTG